MALSAERRAALLAAKLTALVRSEVPEAAVVPDTFGGGAAVLVAGSAWILLDDRPSRGLGGALAWASRHGVETLNVVAESDTGILARKASYFASPPKVWAALGRDLVPAVADPFPPPAAPPAGLDRWRARIEAAGAVPVLEHGVLAGEVLGLEVCRLTVDPATGEQRLEVGVGAHDREAFLIVHGAMPPADALADVVHKVEVLRGVPEPPHALRRLAAERLLRHRLVDDPSLVGAVALEASPPPVPRLNLKEATPCVAAGIDNDGRSLVAVCSVGIDLDVVPFAADARAALGDLSARLVIAVPERDAHPVTDRLARLLARPAEVVSISD